MPGLCGQPPAWPRSAAALPVRRSRRVIRHSDAWRKQLGTRDAQFPHNGGRTLPSSLAAERGTAAKPPAKATANPGGSGAAFPP